MNQWQLIRKYYLAKYRAARINYDFNGQIKYMRLVQKNCKRITPIRLRVLA